MSDDAYEDAVSTAYIPVNVLTKWTFESKPIREWVEQRLRGRVLNAAAGRSKLSHDGEIVRNDIDESIDADIHVDVSALSSHFERNSFDTIVFDPPWSLYQANLRYDGNHVYSTNDDMDTRVSLDELPIEVPTDKTQLGHARLAKDGFAYLLRPGGIVIQLTYHGKCMPNRLGFDKIERVIFDPIGRYKAVIGSVDVNTQSEVDDYD